MGTIYAPPLGIGDRPQFGTGDFDEYTKQTEEYINKVKEWAKSHGSGECAGEELSLPHADGYARYVVFSLKPVKLIHLPVYDAWSYPHIERLTASDIKKNIQQRKSLGNLFANRTRAKQA